MDKENISEEERQLCSEIIETGQKKFCRELQKLADLAQVSVDVKRSYHPELAHKMCDICRWLSNARLSRPNQCKAAGIWLDMNPDKDYGQYRRMSVEDGADEYMLEWSTIPVRMIRSAFHMGLIPGVGRRTWQWTLWHTR